LGFSHSLQVPSGVLQDVHLAERLEHVEGLLAAGFRYVRPDLEHIVVDVVWVLLEQPADGHPERGREATQPFVRQPPVARFQKADDRAGGVDLLGKLRLGQAPMLAPGLEEVLLWVSRHDALCKHFQQWSSRKLQILNLPSNLQYARYAP